MHDENPEMEKQKKWALSVWSRPLSPHFILARLITGCCVCGEMKYYAFTRNTKQVLFKVYVKGKMWAVAKVLYIVSNHTGPLVCAPGGRLSRRD